MIYPKYCFSAFKWNPLLVEKKNNNLVTILLQITSHIICRRSGSNIISWEFLYILKFWVLVNTDSASHMFPFQLSLFRITHISWTPKNLNSQKDASETWISVFSTENTWRWQKLFFSNVKTKQKFILIVLYFKDSRVTLIYSYILSVTHFWFLFPDCSIEDIKNERTNS